MSTASESDENHAGTPDSPSSATPKATTRAPPTRTTTTRTAVARATTAAAVHPLGLQGVRGAQAVPGGLVRRKGSEWEILGSLEAGIEYSIMPKKKEGFLSKKRKWPLKGWHKRYFILEGGLLTYGKTAQDIARGRTHGRIDVGAAVISAKTESLRIDIDDEEYIHHIKVNNLETFGIWLEQLKQHRLYRQQQSINSSSGSANSPEGDALMSLGNAPQVSGFGAASPRSSLPRGARAPSKFQQDFATLEDNLTTRLLKIQQHAVALALLTQRAEDEHNAALGQSGPKAKKLFGLRKKKSAAASMKSSSDQGSGFAIPNSRSSTLTSEKQINPTTVTAIETEVDSSSVSTLSHMSSSLSASNPSLVSGASSVSGSVTASNNGSQQTSMPSPKQSASRPISLPADAANKNATKSNLGSSLSVASNSSTLTAASNTTAGTSSGMGSEASSAKNVLMEQLMPSTRDEMMNIAQEIHVDVSNLLRCFTADRDRLKASLEAIEFSNKSSTMGNSSQVAMIASLRQALNSALQQNSIMKARLQKIHLDSETADLPPVPAANVDTLTRDMKHSLSYSSSCISEFFDAREYGSDQQAPSVYSSESEETGSNPSDTETSDDDQNFVEALSPSALVTTGSSKENVFSLLASSPTQSSTALSNQNVSSASPVHSKLTEMTGRREKLPVPKTETEGINLWNLLCKNIGKDLSKISMPVTLNEPLSALQRLCEELEYSELLDKAASADTELQRMTWVAAFAVSVYGSCQARAGHKPFNPLLGETFECVREDRGFRYVAEQVSHHPPVSACHASATNGKWTWEQELRVKTKFWGKSMEFQPLGSVRVVLNGNEVYEWNKITTCIHNLFGGSDRWVDLYGQCVIKAKRLTARIDFVKASYWSNKGHEIYGTIVDKNEQVQQHLFGKWSEALYCGKAPSSKCIWRPAILPADSGLYYGFSRFAIELNELLESEKDLLPITDTRFRPDQRLLEEGHITEAENMKLKLEQNQRERRHEMEAREEKHEPKWFVKLDEEKWQFNKRYWKVRARENNEGFESYNLDKLW